jgi:hypothetical protein
MGIFKRGELRVDSKFRLSQISRSWLQGVSEVLALEEAKRGSHSWREGVPFSQLVDEAMGQLTAWNERDELDPETGKSRLHVASAILMRLSSLVGRENLDDRYGAQGSAPVKASNLAE